MKHETFHSAAFEGQSDIGASVRSYLLKHRDAFWHAADRLGGCEAARRVGWLIDALEQQTTISRRAHRLLDDLLELLTLENVGDPDRSESGCFAMISPDDPAVEEICLLTDGLLQALEQMGKHEQRIGCLDTANKDTIALHTSIQDFHGPK